MKLNIKKIFLLPTILFCEIFAINSMESLPPNNQAKLSDNTSSTQSFGNDNSTQTFNNESTIHSNNSTIRTIHNQNNNLTQNQNNNISEINTNSSQISINNSSIQHSNSVNRNKIIENDLSPLIKESKSNFDDAFFLAVYEITAFIR